MVMYSIYFLSPLLMVSYVLGNTAIQVQPYFLAFSHATVDLRYHCNAEFLQAQNMIYETYVEDLVESSTMSLAIANKIDPDWSIDPIHSPISLLPPLDRRLNRCLNVCNDNLFIIISQSCCNYCGLSSCRRSRNLVGVTDTMLDRNPEKAIRGSITRKLRNSTQIFVVKPIRNPKTGYIIVKSSGNSSSTSTAQGAAIAKALYNAVRNTTTVDNPCRGTLLGANYKIMAMEVVKL